MQEAELRQLASKIEGFCPEEECAVLYSLAKDTPAQGAIVDIGSFKGRTTICFAKAQAETRDGLVYAIEVNFFHTKEKLLKNIADFGVKDWVIPIFSHSAQANKHWGRLPIKLIFMDTDGNYFSAACDFLLWEPYLLVGGVIAFSCAQNAGIKKLANKYLVHSTRFRDVTTFGSLVFAYKSKETPFVTVYKRGYIRMLYLLHFKMRKLFHAFTKGNLANFSDRQLWIKRVVNRLFERLGHF